MLVLRLKQYVPVSGEVQIATTWQVSRDTDFAVLIVDEKSTTKLNLSTYNLNVPAGEVWYGRAIRHFDTPSYDYTTAYRKTLGTDSPESTILLEDEIEIITPTVNVSKDDVLSDAVSFTVTSSKYKGNDAQQGSIWIIRDGNDDVLFYTKSVGTNLESITITKTSDMLNKNVLKFSCIHISMLGVESPVGTAIIELTSYNFELGTNLEQVIPLKDLKVVFNKINANISNGIVSIDVNEASTGQTYYNKILQEDDFITIPWYVLNPNYVFNLVINARNSNGDLSFTTKKLSVQKGKEIDVNDPSFNYTDTVAASAFMDQTFVPNGTVSEELPNSTILVPIYGNKTVSRFVLNTTTGLYENKGIVIGLSLLSTNVDNTYIKVLPGDNLLIDTDNGSGHPCFLHYTYNRGTNTATLISTYSRNDETIGIGKTNAIVWVSDTEFIYLPVGLNTLRKYNIVTATMVDLLVVPNANMNTGIIFRVSGGRILIIGGDYTNYLYDIQDNLVTEGVSTYPNTFVNRELKSVKLINGDVLIYKTSYKPETENSMLHFNYQTSLFTEVPYVFEKDKVPTTSLSFLNGDIGLIRYNYKEFWEDKENELITLVFK